MTVGTLKRIFEAHHIPDDVRVMSDSGWEYNETDMDGVYYNEFEKRIIFTQCGTEYDHWFGNGDWKLIHSENGWGNLVK